MNSSVITDANPAISLAQRYQTVRKFTSTITAPLSAEDCMVQSMDDASPTRWHLAHTTWFFETFVLKPHAENYREYDPQFAYLFNSYYNTVGKQFPRPQRGLVSRPGLEAIRKYRSAIDDAMSALLESENLSSEVAAVIETGLHHEQQHQELILTDIKHLLSCNPMLPVYCERPFAGSHQADAGWFDIPAGMFEVGHRGDGMFCFDNELPRHSTYLHQTAIATRPVTCGQYIEFMEDGGYQNPLHWLAQGWGTVQESGWDAPLYWVQRDGQWHTFTLAGLVPIDPDWPVCHVSYFEADAFARWSGNRLPTESEWEVASQQSIGSGQFADLLTANNQSLHPTGTAPSGSLNDMFGGVWEWTSSPYTAYPGYAPPPGAIGEYNGKFMCNQYVLRGGSVATSSDHIRDSYRNFFPSHTRWQFSGFRLAR